MPYSPILSAARSTPGALVITLVNFEENALSQEKPMLMAELTYMLLSILGKGVVSEGPTYSMLMAITQMSLLRTAHHRQVSTTRARMVTLSQGDWNDQLQVLPLHEKITGLTLSLQQTERNFTSVLWSMLHEIYVPALHPSQSMPIGDIEQIQLRIEPQKGYLSLWNTFQSSCHGHKTMLAEM